MAVLFTDAAPVIEGLDAVMSWLYFYPPGEWRYKGTYSVYVTWELIKNKDDIVDTTVGRWTGGSYPQPVLASFPTYNAASTYAAYAQVTYSGVWYWASAAIVTPEAWNAAHWNVAFSYDRGHVSAHDLSSTPGKYHLREEYTFTQPDYHT